MFATRFMISATVPPFPAPSSDPPGSRTGLSAALRSFTPLRMSCIRSSRADAGVSDGAVLGLGGGVRRSAFLRLLSPPLRSFRKSSELNTEEEQAAGPGVVGSGAGAVEGRGGGGGGGLRPL